MEASGKIRDTEPLLSKGAPEPSEEHPKANFSSFLAQNLAGIELNKQP